MDNETLRIWECPKCGRANAHTDEVCECGYKNEPEPVELTWHGASRVTETISACVGGESPELEPPGNGTKQNQ
jgi:uncharacterized OB-fold protein